MPYIKPERRSAFRDAIDALPEMDNPGELNYILTKVLKEYRVTNYQDINDILGALEGAKLEFYRRIAAPYEDQKIKENGDVY